MVIGWSCCALMLIILSLHTIPEPYWCRDENGKYIETDPATKEVTGYVPCNHCHRVPVLLALYLVCYLPVRLSLPLSAVLPSLTAV